MAIAQFVKFMELSALHGATMLNPAREEVEVDLYRRPVRPG